MAQANSIGDLNSPCPSQSYCRLCLFPLQNDIFTNVFFTFSNTQSIAGVIKDFFKVKIMKDDTFSKLICANCFNKLIEIFNFKALVKNSDQKLRETICEEAKVNVNQEVGNVICVEDTKLVEQVDLKAEVTDVNDSTEIGSSMLKERIDKIQVVPPTVNKKKRKKKKSKMSDETNGTTRIQCKMCNKSYVNYFDFKNHTYRHTGLYPFRCSTCNKGLPYKGALVRHLMTHQPKYEICQICKTAFWFKFELRVHQRSAHVDEDCFKCIKCKFLFPTKLALDEHSSKHIKKKPPRICQYCGTEFSTGRKLKEHRRRKHKKKKTTAQSAKNND